jgi:hypothetical protein
VNHPQGYPKTTLYSYLRKAETGLVHALLSPGKVDTEVQDKPVPIDCQTDYRFKNSFSYLVKCQDPFELYLGVPKWATMPVAPQSSLIEIKVPPGTTNIRYDLGRELQAVPRANDIISV